MSSCAKPSLPVACASICRTIVCRALVYLAIVGRAAASCGIRSLGIGACDYEDPTYVVAPESVPVISSLGVIEGCWCGFTMVIDTMEGSFRRCGLVRGCGLSRGCGVVRRCVVVPRRLVCR
ncbi:hypothetical protein AYI69_g6600 [Smittium culicis]|uniref:Uncharacterized protein n=1 Tax=Smittium culicis TaxID=133412 RepID=A0A1R1XY89_9FUNG|nr:hypothetical protein AYI69_g11172 [Smittium culicis]OMJ19484.1 hypothetical protein AYI69_g6600 [Smittium culicis]